MRASERLKALAVSKAIDWPAPSYEAYRMAEDAERLRMNAIERALPELIALVEAAETDPIDLRWNEEQFTDDAYPSKRLTAALAALDAKLSQA